MTTQTLYLIDEYLMQGGYTQGIDAETLESEAVLVAAAPDLLAALNTLIWQLDRMDGLPDELECMVADAKGAISKAKGA
jgi:hypothetical protein